MLFWGFCTQEKQTFKNKIKAMGMSSYKQERFLDKLDREIRVLLTTKEQLKKSLEFNLKKLNELNEKNAKQYQKVSYYETVKRIRLKIRETQGEISKRYAIRNRANFGLKTIIKKN